MEQFIKLSEAAKQINRTPLSIKHWYRWVATIGEDALPVKLPPFKRIGTRGDMYIKADEVYLLKQFRDYIAVNRGIMSDYNTCRRGEIGLIQADKKDFVRYIKNA